MASLSGIRVLDLSMREATVALIGEQVVAHAATGHVPERTGNRDPVFAPQGAYRCRGDDQWLTISVRSDDEWRRLCAAIGRPELAADPQYASAASRRAEHDALDAIMSEWASEQDAREATAQL